MSAHTEHGSVLSIDSTSTPRRYDNESDETAEEPDEHTLPEEFGEQAAFRLLEEIYRSGCVDSASQCLALTLMACSPPDVSKLLLGPLSPAAIRCLQHIKQFLGVVFKFDPPSPATTPRPTTDASVEKVLLTCIGAGLCNTSRAII